MPWWGWLIIVYILIAVPIKFKVLKKMAKKREEENKH